MNFFENLKHFSLGELISTISDPVNIGIILSLIVIEGLLSSDNALVLAVMVKHLPPKQRKRALFYGIMGAYFFRFVAIALGTLLIGFWWVKLFGAAYLLWVAVKFFINRPQNCDPDKVPSNKYGFWRTVLAVEMMDIAFSLDSILAALGISDKLWVLYLGAIFGILMMRGVAQVFVKLIDRCPEMEITAHVIVGFIGIKMGLTLLGIHMPDYVFFVITAVLFAGTFLYNKLKQKKRCKLKK